LDSQIARPMTRPEFWQDDIDIETGVVASTDLVLSEGGGPGCLTCANSKVEGVVQTANSAWQVKMGLAGN
jgi:hypothetical protein